MMSPLCEPYRLGMESHCGGVDLVEDWGIINPYKGQRYQHLFILVEQIPQTRQEITGKSAPTEENSLAAGTNRPFSEKHLLAH